MDKNLKNPKVVEFGPDYPDFPRQRRDFYQIPSGIGQYGNIPNQPITALVDTSNPVRCTSMDKSGGMYALYVTE